MPSPEILRVAVLVDLPRTPLSGGHVKCWERLAEAAARSALPLDLTVYFSGPEATKSLGPHTRFRQLPPVFSTANFKFLPYMPDTTDMAPYHARLARELMQYDVIHTTDGFFAFARTAARVGRKSGIPLVTSCHTDTPSYTRIFTRQTIRKIFRRQPRLRHLLIETWKIPERQAQRMQRKLERHIELCRYAVMTRPEDHDLADRLLGKDRVSHLRLGVDKNMFTPRRADRAGIERDYNIPAGRIVVLFVGRVDVGKNIHTLIEAMERLVAEGVPLHLLAAGVGPATDDVKRHLPGHASIPGFVNPEELARLYASADVLALSSEVEIRSMVGMEAMASGCPTLVSQKSGVAELFHNTAAMEVVESGVESWANALRDFAGNPARRKQMRDAALVYSETQLAGWETVLAEDLFAVWKKAAAASRRKAA